MGCSGSLGFAQADPGKRFKILEDLEIEFAAYNSTCSSSFSCINNCCFPPYFQSYLDKVYSPTVRMGIWLQHPLAELKNILACSVLLHWSMRRKLGNWNIWRAFCKIFVFLFSNPVQSVQQRNRNIFVPLQCMVEQLKVTADFSLCFYHTLQMPLRCFFLCYLKILCYIDFCFFL